MEGAHSRVMAVWCPDWPAVAAATSVGCTVADPIAVLHAGRVEACSRAARTVGVRRGMRKRQAQSLCPDLIVCDADPDRDGRLFEPVIGTVSDVVPLTEVLRPGLLVVTADRASRYFGGEDVLAERIVDAAASAGVTACVGTADELFTAVLAARSGQSVPPGTDAAYLATRPISDLTIEPSLSAPGRADLVDLLWRLGLRTLGSFAELPAADVASRFTADAVDAHRLARAVPGRRPSRAPVPAALDVEHECDPPVDRIDAAAFLGRRLAEELHQRLAASSLACMRLTVHAVTERGQRHSRTWRCAQPLTPDATADRVRWQLEGWLTGGRAAGGGAPDSPIVRLRLEPVEVVDPGTLQYAFTGAGLPAAVGGGLSDRARRALVRVQGLLGGESVRVPVRSGGRGPDEQVALVTLGDEPVVPHDPDAAWPDRLARPTPALLSHVDAEVLDAEDAAVTVTARGDFTTEPTDVRIGRRQYRLRWWAGPWPFGVEGAGSDTAVSARAQVLLEDSRALLLCYREQSWTVEGVYE
ncbi:DNA polymerase Y family protein [Gordonia zhaorongruii]|uniref:DNA polymerase Y family protein n=1 Tax=Gordonia zhaorongruii TaxID=2597659 RepID=UPI00104FB7D5|nr:DNA polymerase Y family protein [Gordonia zhaorongruii]